MRYTVYIVDDEAANIKSLERILNVGDYNLKMFTSPVDALAELQNTEPHLVISDRKMPHMDGTDLLKRVKEMYPHCRCILVSGHPISQTEENALTQGAIDRFFTKPLDVKKFLNEIHLLFGAR